MKPSTPSRHTWSWHLGKLFGISIRVHVTLLALLAWVATAAALGGGHGADVLVDLATMVFVFAIVVLHELAHALVARRFDCTTREIVLLPIGGIARIERMPERPLHELLVAVAGPALNIVLAGFLALVIAAAGSTLDPTRATTVGAALLSRLLWINISLAVFNLIPAFPMDGGRVLRAVLASLLDRRRATRIAGAIGKGLAVLFVVGGFLASPMLALIGVFVWFASDYESAALELRRILATAPVESAMIRDIDVVEAGDSITTAASRMLAAGTQLLAVTDGDTAVGMVRAADLARVMDSPSRDAAVALVMHRDLPVVATTDSMASALDVLNDHEVALVADGGALVGLITAEQIAAYADFHRETPAPATASASARHDHPLLVDRHA
jgi:Zn-dependent protease/CBS domain-containing protein